MVKSTSTEQFVSIDTFRDNCVVLKDGSLRAIIMVAGINFALKSNEEQNLILGSFQSLLNRLDFSLQFIVHSRTLNMDDYLNNLKRLEENEENILLRNQIKEYHIYIENLIKVANVMSKRFYVVVPYSATILEAGKGLAKVFSYLPFGKVENEAKQKQEDFEVKKTQLKHRVNSILSGLRATGVKAIRLETDELIELYYNLYNPEKKEKKVPKIVESIM
jgi:type IV secretory pathway VirB4 component